MIQTSLEFRRLVEEDYDGWVAFHNKAYGRGYILTDRDFLHWYLKKDNKYETLIAIDGKTIVGTYGVLQAPLRVKDRTYKFCWFASGMVLQEYRGQGIGQTFVKMLLDNFDACGGIGFNAGVRKNYIRFGFNQFGFSTLRRYALVIRDSAYSLIEEKHRNEMMKFLQISTSIRNINCKIGRVQSFSEPIVSCFADMNMKAYIEREPEYMNWRYFQNPIKYEIYSIQEKAYIVVRHERFYPTQYFAARIIDLVGLPQYASELVKLIINKSRERHDAFIDFSVTGSYYGQMFKELDFSELTGEYYGALPQVSSPIEYRPNEEYICLGSKHFPKMFDGIEFDDLYFTRGDSDRDRFNPIKDGVEFDR